MANTVTIRCKNNGKKHQVLMGSKLWEAYEAMDRPLESADRKYHLPPVAAKVNNKTEGMHYRLYKNKQVEFIDITDPSGRRVYSRTLFFVLCKAVHDIFPESIAIIDIPVSNGYYCDIRIFKDNVGESVKAKGRFSENEYRSSVPVSAEGVVRIRQRMQEIIDAKMPIRRHEVPTEEAIAMFREKGDMAKVKLLESVGSLYTTYYQIDDYVDYYYGALLTDTSQLSMFGLDPYYEGALLRIPSKQNPQVLGEMVHQDKLFGIFKEHHRWQYILGINTVGDFNTAVKEGHAVDVMNISEALQEKRLAEIANEIASKKDVRLVLIAGPSSSGKTTTSKRLSIQMVINGLRPIPISLDDYFVDREKTPRDEKGEYDYESLYSLNLPLLNEHLEKLFRGEEVEMPRYDFPTGRSVMSGKRLRLNPGDVLVVEGIHALNPELTAQIPAQMKYKLYASALTTILLDYHNYISTTDNRLLRRIIRDYKYRGCSALDTIHRWPSVKRGENKWIFPYQENADAVFNTAMIYELAVIRQQAEPLLEQVPENCPEYSEAYRLRKFLRYFTPIDYQYMPHNSLLREFFGGSLFDY